MEYIKDIEIKNFKSIRHQVIEGCKRINVFIGYPNTGKSNILEAIGSFSSLLVNENYFRFNEICRVRHFTELFFNKDYRDATNVILNNKILLELIINPSNELELRTHRLVDHSGNPEVDGLGNRHPDNIFSATINNKDYLFRISRSTSVSQFKDIVGPIRKYEFKNDVIINQQRPFVLSFPFGDNLLDILQRDSNLRKEIATLFDDYNLKLFIDGEEIKFLKYLNDGTGVSIPYHQVADTLRRLIFYKAAILSNKDSILLFEEPEAHMFPPYIKTFTTDIIFDKTNQFFIATHSPYVLNALLEDAADDLAVYLVYYNAGETKIKLMLQQDLEEVREYGVDLFFNLESYLKHGQVGND